MRPVPPSEVIAEYMAAYQRVNGPVEYPVCYDLRYERGWYVLVNGLLEKRYRGAQIIHMTAALNERAKAKG